MNGGKDHLVVAEFQHPHQASTEPPFMNGGKESDWVYPGNLSALLQRSRRS